MQSTASELKLAYFSTRSKKFSINLYLVVFTLAKAKIKNSISMNLLK